ncbi:tRNA-(ms[2]io[6]A)-hydroxylase [Pseudomaricurvus sp. HS19]|uniref:tRNA-(ms[2]io[6]A)-hydroxylase n=1 Tax=Pseudomaricurvus sp. HS19 TaxID=2692626 RepID=UPI00136A1D47|nr:tRNA isopentenyl-2-thiomethyl-A-37 hydroxylase MiaE [Pseudomaricurvus sp. HS19]MYM62536.1 tRNA-(ms[2]io[6]A)-hydroxylase [Pseudomaricurvus sp. HS19]
MSEVNIDPILDYLPCVTPDAWLERAPQELEIVLLDHAANEMKAAQSAMTLMSKNPTKVDLLNKMSRLAREELVHFENVLKILKRRGIEYRALKASRYAAHLAKHIRREQRENLVDTLIVGSIIEARSCERFAALAPRVDRELAKFYLSLLKSEARHFRDYLTLAERYSDEDISGRVDHFLALEQETIVSPDPLFRFHSGVPVGDRVAPEEAAV